MATVTPETTVNEVLKRWPQAAVIVNRYGLDMCCGGGLSLRVACLAAGADLEALLADLRTLAAEVPAGGA